MAYYGPFILNLIPISHFSQLIATSTRDSEFLILNCTQTSSNPTIACLQEGPEPCHWVKISSYTEIKLKT